ncbi:hypothetical protein AB0916_34320, partial [Streptomyces sp. NPDC005476]
VAPVAFSVVMSRVRTGVHFPGGVLAGRVQARQDGRCGAAAPPRRTHPRRDQAGKGPVAGDGGCTSDRAMAKANKAVGSAGVDFSAALRL